MKPEFFHDNKAFLRAKPVVVNGGNKPREQVQAEELIKRYKQPDLEKLWQAVSSDAFLDVCDLLRLDNSIMNTEKTYDQFAQDLVEIIRMTKFISKKK